MSAGRQAIFVILTLFYRTAFCAIIKVIKTGIKNKNRKAGGL
jgi:hypothetical protein